MRPGDKNVIRMVEGKFGAARWSDLGGATNPKNIWSPEYIFLKQAVDTGADPATVVNCLRDWLSVRGVPRSEITALLRLDPDTALSELIELLKAGLNAEHLPADAKLTLRRALNRIASEHVTHKQTELDAQQAELDRIQTDFKESTSAIVNHLLEAEGACVSCEREFGVHNPNASHGYCKRHLIEMYKGMRQTPEITAKIEKIMQSPDSAFVPDMSKMAPEQRGRKFDFATKQFARQ